MDSALRSAEASVNGFKGRVQGLEPVFKNMQKWGVVAFAAVGTGILASANNFQKFNVEIERAGAFVNATAEEMDMMREAAVNAARGTAFSFEQTAVALQNFVGGEVSATEAAAELSNIVDLALVASMDDLQAAVNLGDLSLTVFKDDAMEMSDVIDIIATVASDITTQTERWSAALVNSAGAAKSAGFSFKELNVIFAQMVRGGADVNLIWSAFNSAMSSVQAPGKQALEALEGVGLSAKGLAAALREGPIPFLEYLRQGFETANESGTGFAFLADVLGRQAAPEFALALGQTNETLQETSDWFEEINGRGAVLVEKLREAQPASVVLGQALSELNLVIGEALSPVLEELMAIILPIIQSVTTWAAEHPKLSAAIALGVLGLTAMVVVLGTIGLMLPAIIAGFGLLFAPITGLIALFGLAVAAGYLLATNWEGLRDKAIQIWEGIKNAFKAAADWIYENAIQPLLNWVDSLRSALEAVASTITGVVSGAGKVIGKAVKAVIPGRAVGGPVTGGKPYIVGERGPELFVPGQSGTVVPNSAGINVTISGNTISSALDVRDIAEQVGREIMRSLKMAQQV